MAQDAVDHVGDGLEPTVRMPRGPLRLSWAVVDLAHLVHVHEGVQNSKVVAGDCGSHSCECNLREVQPATCPACSWSKHRHEPRAVSFTEKLALPSCGLRPGDRDPILIDMCPAEPLEPDLHRCDIDDEEVGEAVDGRLAAPRSLRQSRAEAVAGHEQGC